MSTSRFFSLHRQTGCLNYYNIYHIHVYTSKCVHGAWRGGGVLHFVLVECVGDSIHNHSHHEPQTGGDEAINTASFETAVMRHNLSPLHLIWRFLNWCGEAWFGAGNDNSISSSAWCFVHLSFFLVLGPRLPPACIRKAALRCSSFDNS